MKKKLAMVLLSVVSAVASAAPATTVTFSKGLEAWEGWSGMGGGSWISSTPDKHGAALYTYAIETFGLTWTTRTNPAFVFDYGKSRKLTLGMDIKVNSITYDGREVERDLVLELRDYDKPYGGMPFTSVWYKVGKISAAQPGWRHMSVTIHDTQSKTLPSGWGGYGDGGVALPPGRTFADVLAGIDEVVFTTFVPGMFYGWTNYDVAVDNISIKVQGKD